MAKISVVRLKILISYKNLIIIGNFIKVFAPTPLMVNFLLFFLRHRISDFQRRGARTFAKQRL